MNQWVCEDCCPDEGGADGIDDDMDHGGEDPPASSPETPASPESGRDEAVVSVLFVWLLLRVEKGKYLLSGSPPPHS